MDFFGILFDIKNGKKVPYSKTYFDTLFAAKLGGSDVKTLTGTLPLTFRANGDDLLNYRIYGTVDGAGVQTESDEPTGYKLPLTNTGENLWQKSEAPGYDYSTDYKRYNADKAVTLSAGTYTLSSDGRLPIIQVFTPELIRVVPANSVVSYSDNTYALGWNDYALMPPSISTTKVATITLLQDAVLTFAVFSDIGTYLLINKGDTVLRADYPLYIGDSKLLSGDYVDYESGKIVRNGTPQDPPLPLPAIETFEGTNTLDSTETLGEVTIKGQIKPQS